MKNSKNIVKKWKIFLLFFVLITLSGLVVSLADGTAVSELPIGILVLSPFSLLSALTCVKAIDKDGN